MGSKENIDSSAAVVKLKANVEAYCQHCLFQLKIGKDLDYTFLNVLCISSMLPIFPSRFLVFIFLVFILKRYSHVVWCCRVHLMSF